jgi:hypothetical protein
MHRGLHDFKWACRWVLACSLGKPGADTVRCLWNCRITKTQTALAARQYNSCKLCRPH